MSYLLDISKTNWKTVSSSVWAGTNIPSLAIDGNAGVNVPFGDCFHAKATFPREWMAIDFGKVETVCEVKILPENRPSKS